MRHVVPQACERARRRRQRASERWQTR
jgi:hypothetical protein